MVDMRTLSMDERRALAAQAEELARAGVAPAEIRARLGVAYGTYSRWARLYGFRQRDVRPGAALAGAPLNAPPGPGEPGQSARSGRYYLNQGATADHPVRETGAGHPGWSGGKAASRGRYDALRDARRDAAGLEVAGLSPSELLDRVEEALAEGALSEADRLLRAWRAQARRLAGVAALQAERHCKEPPQQDFMGMSDEELEAYVEALGDR